MELPCRVTRYLSGLGLNRHPALRDGGTHTLDLLLARFSLHVAAVALWAAVLVVGAAHRLQERRRRKNLSGGHGMRQRMTYNLLMIHIAVGFIYYSLGVSNYHVNWYLLITGIFNELRFSIT